MAIIDDRTTGRGYALPNPANKLKDDVPRMAGATQAIDDDITDILLALAGKASTTHGHAISAITGLSDALAGKISVGYHDALDDLSDVDTAGASNGQVIIRQSSKWIPVALQVNNIAGLEALLNGKATPADLSALKAELLGGAGAAYDTFKELQDLLNADESALAALTTVVSNKLDTSAFGTTLTSTLHAAPSKATPVDADELGFWNSVGGVLGKLTFANLRSWLLAFFPRFDAAQTLTQAQKGQLASNSGQAWEQIGAEIVLGASQAIVSWTGLAAYKRLRLIATATPTVVAQLVAQLGEQGGTVWHNGANTYANQRIFSGGTSLNASYVASTSFGLMAADGGVSTPAMIALEVDNFNKAALASMRSRGGYNNTIPQYISGINDGYDGTLAAVGARDSLRVFFTAGNILIGSSFVLEGIRG